MIEVYGIPVEELRRVRRDMYLRGTTIKQWADDHSFNATLVYLVLSGKSRASRGKTHEIAVRLGLKPDYRRGEGRTRTDVAITREVSIDK